jgi:hypothetical protein
MKTINHKLSLVIAMLFVAMTICAQSSITVIPKLNKGTKKVYRSESVSNLAGKTIKTVSEVQYTVTKKTATGYVMNYEITKIENDTIVTDAVSRIFGIFNELLKNTRLELATDMNGMPVSIINYEEVKNKTLATAQALADELFQNFPESSNFITKEKLIEQFTSNMTEDMLIKSIRNISSPLALNGKTISAGTEELYTGEQGIQMKRTYTLNGSNSITAQANVNMTQEEFKQLLISQMEKLLPNQAEMVKNNIDMVMASGMFKIEATEKAIYELQADNWIKSLVVEKNVNMFGQKTSTVTNVTIKN